MRKRPIEEERFYGRRVGRKAGIRRAFVAENLPAFSLSPEDLSPLGCLEGLFSKAVTKKGLEIGFGSGEHLIQQILSHPDMGMVGIEPFQDGMAHVLQKAQTHPTLEGRLKLIPEDARLFLPLLPQNAFEKIFVLFSDPWPKKRHRKRRLIQAPFLEKCASLLKERGQLLLAHDHTEYIEEILGLLKAQKTLIYRGGGGISFLEASDWPSWPSDWPMTRYGKKALDQGKPLAFFVWEKPATYV